MDERDDDPGRVDDEPAAARRRTPERGGADVGDRLAARARVRSRTGRRAFDTGNVIAKTFSIWMGSFVPFTALAALVYSPMIVWILVLHAATPSPAVVMLSLLAIPATLVLSQLITAALIFGVFQRLRGERASIGRCVSVAMARVLPVIGVGILVVLLYLLPLLPAGAVGVAAAIGGPASENVGLALLLGLLGLIPAIAIALGLMAAVPAVVVERIGVLGALSRSWTLTRGSRLQILLIAFVIGLVVGVVGCVFQMPTQAMPGHPAGPILDLVGDILMAPLQAILPAVIYHDLRVNKEGIASDELAAIFD